MWRSCSAKLNWQSAGRQSVDSVTDQANDEPKEEDKQPDYDAVPAKRA
jgi:hypothetical protein